jgi:hypothetical protein
VLLGVVPAAYVMHSYTFEMLEINHVFAFSIFLYTIHIIHITVSVLIEKKEYMYA